MFDRSTLRMMGLRSVPVPTQINVEAGFRLIQKAFLLHVMGASFSLKSKSEVDISMQAIEPNIGISSRLALARIDHVHSRPPEQSNFLLSVLWLYETRQSMVGLIIIASFKSMTLGQNP